MYRGIWGLIKCVAMQVLIKWYLDGQGLSIACSTPHALTWDASWADSHEISGRAMAGVHVSADHALPPPGNNGEAPIANGGPYIATNGVMKTSRTDSEVISSPCRLCALSVLCCGGSSQMRTVLLSDGVCQTGTVSCVQTSPRWDQATIARRGY